MGRKYTLVYNVFGRGQSAGQLYAPRTSAYQVPAWTSARKSLTQDRERLWLHCGEISSQAGNRNAGFFCRQRQGSSTFTLQVSNFTWVHTPHLLIPKRTLTLRKAPLVPVAKLLWRVVISNYNWQMPLVDNAAAWLRGVKTSFGDLCKSWSSTRVLCTLPGLWQLSDLISVRPCFDVRCGWGCDFSMDLNRSE